MKLNHWFAFALCFSLAMSSLAHSQPAAPELKSLAPSTGTLVPAFSPKRTAYLLQVPHGTAGVSFKAESATADAALTVNGQPFAATQAYPLGVGSNTIELALKSGQAQTVYRLTVLRDGPTPNWQKVLANGPFPIRDSAGELVFDNRMWLLGGYFPKLSGDVWHSADGTNWQEATPIPIPHGINIPLNYVFNGKMWVVDNEGQLFASGDGKAWELVDAKPAWGKRYAAGGVVFNGKMWVFGGRKGQALMNDVWSSADGRTWKQEVENAPWSPRQLFGNVVVKDGKIWLIGGGVTNYAPFRAYRDVWVSENGIDWQQVTDQAPWPGRIWSNCVVYRDRIFLLGGFRSQPNWENLGDAWYSADGRTWHELKTETSWEARHEHSSYVFNDRLWVVSGNKWPLLNDVWSLEIPGLTFLTQPVLQEFIGAQYQYRARADFNSGARPVSYRLRSGPQWLTLDSQSGVLSGICRQAGQYPVVLEATDENGETARQEFTIEIIAL